ncbi:MAG: hypothetical protein KAU28_08930, partial [Phycisphaerae bacterium]|nr:hypothetical protein [Phycisphaerae bacterium]
MPVSAKRDNSPNITSGRAIFAGQAAAALLAGRIAELSHPNGRWEKVKHNASRTVFRGDVDGIEIYLKHYHSRTLIHRLARLLGFSDAKCEMRFAQYLSSRGIETAPPLASMCSGGFEWFATEAVAPAETADKWHLKQLHRGRDGWRAIQSATIALGRIVGRKHAAGVIHRDLHCGNILVRTDTDPPKLVLTDLHRAYRRRRLSRRAKAANLAQLFHDRYTFTTRTERLRFLKEYLRASGAGGTLRGWQLMVEDFAGRHTRRQHAQRDRRTVGQNQYFSRVKLPRHWRGHVVLASKRRPV